MGFWSGVTQKARAASAIRRMQHNSLFEQVVHELENQQYSKGAWAQALAENDGDEQRARAAYLRIRANALADELAVGQAFRKELGPLIEAELIRKREEYERSRRAIERDRKRQAKVQERRQVWRTLSEADKRRIILEEDARRRPDLEFYAELKRKAEIAENESREREPSAFEMALQRRTASGSGHKTHPVTKCLAIMFVAVFLVFVFFAIRS